MNIKEVLSKRDIFIGEKLSSKKEILERLSRYLLEYKIISNSKGFLEDVLERESRGTTFVYNYLAIPHGISDYVNKPRILIYKTDNPIIWDKNNNAVKVIILFVINNDISDEVDKLIKKFASLFGYEELVDELLNSNTSSEIIEVITKFFNLD